MDVEEPGHGEPAPDRPAKGRRRKSRAARTPRPVSEDIDKGGGTIGLPDGIFAPEDTDIPPKASGERREIAPADATIGFSSVSEAVWELEDIETFAVRAVETILKTRDTDPDAVTPPNMEVAVPAIEAMRYSPLRDEIATLIASSMDAGTRDEAHPAFLTVLKQLTRDEVSFLRLLPPVGQFIPAVNIHLSTARDKTRLLQRHVVPEDLLAACDAPERIATYVDNLLRLQLLQAPDGGPMPDAAFYSTLTKQSACQSVLRDRNLRRRSRIERRILGLADFGETFRRVCLN